MTGRPRAERAGLLFFLCLKSPNGEKTDLTFRGVLLAQKYNMGPGLRQG